MGRFEDAIDMWQRDLDICLKTKGVGASHLDTAVTYNNMGVSYSTMGRRLTRDERSWVCIVLDPQHTLPVLNTHTKLVFECIIFSTIKSRFSKTRV